MNPQSPDGLHFEVQLAYARPIVALLATLCLLNLRPAREVQQPLTFLVAYLVLAIVILLLERALHRLEWHLPLVCDLLVILAFLFLSPEIMPAWFLLFFVAFAAGYRWNLRSSLFLSFGLLLLAVALDVARGKMYWTDGAGQIGRANLDGTDQEILMTGQVGPFGIALDIGTPGTAVFYALA